MFDWAAICANKEPGEERTFEWSSGIDVYKAPANATNKRIFLTFDGDGIIRRMETKEDDMEFKGYDLAKIVNQENGFTVMLGARHYVFNSWNDMVEFLNAEFNPFEEE